VFLPFCHKGALATSDGVLMPYVMIGDEPVPVVIVPDLGDSAARLGSGGDQVQLGGWTGRAVDLGQKNGPDACSAPLLHPSPRR
jgi:hypothetical protein